MVRSFKKESSIGGVMSTPKNNITGSTIVLAIVLGVVWFIWSGYTQALIIGFGVFSVLLTVFLSRSLHIIDSEGQPTNIKLGFYLIWLLKEIVVANIDVIKRIITFGPIENTVELTWIKVPAKQKSRLGKVIFANSITLTPGTISVLIEVDGDDSFILVNGVSKEGAESLIGGGEMGQKVCGTGL